MDNDFFDAPGAQGYVKAGFLGFTAAGKTHTAVDLALGIRSFFGMKGPIAAFDSENGLGFHRPKILKATGMEPLIKRARSFADLMAFTAACEKAGVSVAIVDSITHVWKEIQESYLAKVNERERFYAQRNGREPRLRFNLEFQDWGPIRATWEPWTRWYLNSAVHVIICGRAAFEYSNEQNENGKRELIKTGIKMKVDNEFGFEPSLLVEMERAEVNGEQVAQATVIKDRWNLINGKVFNNPTFGDFLPHVAQYAPAGHVGVNADAKTSVPVEDPRNNWSHEQKAREIACEELKHELVKLWPGQSAQEKLNKANKLEELLGTPSWAAVEAMSSERVAAAVQKLRGLA